MLSVHPSVKELEKAGKRIFWFLDSGKHLGYQLPSIKTQTHPPIEGMNISHYMALLEKDFNSGSVRA